MAVPSALPLATAGRLYLKEALGLADQQEVAVAVQKGSLCCGRGIGCQGADLSDEPQRECGRPAAGEENGWVQGDSRVFVLDA